MYSFSSKRNRFPHSSGSILLLSQTKYPSAPINIPKKAGMFNETPTNNTTKPSMKNHYYQLQEKIRYHRMKDRPINNIYIYIYTFFNKIIPLTSMHYTYQKKKKEEEACIIT